MAQWVEEQLVKKIVNLDRMVSSSAFLLDFCQQANFDE